MTRDNPKTAPENDGLGRRCQSSAVLSHLQRPIHTRRGPSRAVFGAPWGRKRAFEKPILHGALLAGDFDAYLKTTSTTFTPDQTSPYAFTQLRRFVPQVALTRGEQKSEAGDTVVLISGCNGPYAYATVVNVEQVEGKPLVRATGGFSRIPSMPGVMNCTVSKNVQTCEVSADCPAGNSCRSKKGGGTECRPSTP